MQNEYDILMQYRYLFLIFLKEAMDWKLLTLAEHNHGFFLFVFHQLIWLLNLPPDGDTEILSIPRNFWFVEFPPEGIFSNYGYQHAKLTKFNNFSHIERGHLGCDFYCFCHWYYEYEEDTLTGRSS